MTPKSDHEEDMSMEEILASIRKFVTDSPPVVPPKKTVYKGDVAQSVVIPPSVYSAREEENHPHPSPVTGRPKESRPPPAPSPAREQQEGRHPYPSMGQPVSQGSPHPYEPDILELKSPVSLAGASQDSHTEWAPPTAPARAPVRREEEGSIMTLTNPIETKKMERPSRFLAKAPQFGEQEEGLGSSPALAASANSLSRLASLSKSVPKKTPSLADQRDLTLDQLIQDMIRPLIKQWIDTHLPSLVEEMVAKEIRRITKHLG